MAQEFALTKVCIRHSLINPGPKLLWTCQWVVVLASVNSYQKRRVELAMVSYTVQVFSRIVHHCRALSLDQRRRFRVTSWIQGLGSRAQGLVPKVLGPANLHNVVLDL